MKTRFVSAAAILICCAIFAIVSAFGYSRYKHAQVENAEFRAELFKAGQDPRTVLATHMPESLSARAAAAAAASASPRPVGQ